MPPWAGTARVGALACLLLVAWVLRSESWEVRSRGGEVQRSDPIGFRVPLAIHPRALAV